MSSHSPTASFAAKKSCFNYVPAVVTLTGKVSYHLAYGPPGYGDDPAHDRKEYYWRLDLPKGICVAGNPGEDSPEAESEDNVHELQIHFGDGLRGSKALVGRRVAITGELNHAAIIHDRTPVMIEARKIETPR